MNWAGIVETYLSQRRRLGYALTIEGRSLQNFSQFAEQKQVSELTVSVALQWANLAPSGSQIAIARRFALLRPFSRYLYTMGLSASILPTKLIGPTHRRLPPFVFSESDITRLMEAASTLTPSAGLRPATVRTLTWSGRRDHILFLVLYNTGARVSEVIRVQCQDVDLQRQHAVRLHGKGRKERIIPLWPQTVVALRNWQKQINTTPDSPVFTNRFGDSITRSGVQQRLRWAQQEAAKTCPSLKHRKISPHTIRHTTALHLLQSGVDLSVIALWLGHGQIDTTHQYMEANLEMKKAALDTLAPAKGQSCSDVRKLPADILAFLETL